MAAARPRRWLRFAKAVEARIGITVSIGLSGNKFLAKVASDLDKPRGFTVLAPEEAPAFLAPRPISFIWGIGKAGAERYAKDGFRTIARSAEGRRDRPRPPLWRRRPAPCPAVDRAGTIAASTQPGTANRSRPRRRSTMIWPRARISCRSSGRLAERVSARLKKAATAGATVTLKLKSADFRIRTRARALHEPTRLATRIFEAGRDLLAKETDGTRYRLIGIGVSDLADLADADHGDLADPGARRLLAAEDAIDAVRERFGSGAVKKGIVFKA